MHARQKQDYLLVGLAALLASGAGFTLQKPFSQDLPLILVQPEKPMPGPSITLSIDVASMRIALPPPESLTIYIPTSSRLQKNSPSITTQPYVAATTYSPQKFCPFCWH